MVCLISPRLLTVYDVTDFVESHPGGWEVLESVSGMDASSAFEDIGHSAEAREMLKKYHLGKFHPAMLKSPPISNKSSPEKKPKATLLHVPPRPPAPWYRSKLIMLLPIFLCWLMWRLAQT